MRQKTKGIMSGMLVVLFVMTSMSMAGPKWEIGDDGWMSLGFLGQPHFSYQDKAADKEDFYLRRGRIILAGQIQDGVKFFVETDNSNAGMNGVSDASTKIQDAFVDVRIGKSEHWVEAGLILLPFSFEDLSSATSLLGVDFNTEVMKLANTFVWRDYGAELHGKFCSRFAYRVGIFDGYDSATGIKNDGAELRYTGHIALNLVGEVETDWFFKQNRLSGDSYLSLGLGGDVQNNATAVTTAADPLAGTPESTLVEDNEAWVVDFHSGCKLGPVGVTLNGAYYDWDNAVFKGNTAFVETGLLLNKTMLVGKYSVQDSDSKAIVEDYTAGLHYFLKGHNMRGGLEYRWGDSNDSVLLGLQFLL